MRWFLPEHITQLYYAPVYREVSVELRRDYNRLYLGYCGEMFILFEETLPAYVVNLIDSGAIGRGAAQAARELVASEQRHAAMFRDLNRKLNPDLYSRGDFYFLRIPGAAKLAVQAALRAPKLFPVVLWIVLLQEERAVYYSQEVLRQAAILDSSVVDVYGRHLADEIAHLEIDAEMLRAVWDDNRAWIRHVNGWLLRQAVEGLLTVPRRAGVRVVEHWIARHPELEKRKPEILRQFAKLGGDPRFQQGFYSRAIVPKTFALLDRYREFRNLGDVLWGYAPEAP